MSMLRALIVDDESLARMRLAQLLADGPPDQPRLAEVVGEAGDAVAALDWLQQHEADVVFLDVQMPGLDGMALAAQRALEAGSSLADALEDANRVLAGSRPTAVNLFWALDQMRRRGQNRR